MVNQELLDYIRQQLEKNISKDQIKSGLMNNGWDASDVEEGFVAVGPRFSGIPPTPPPATPEIKPMSGIINPVMNPAMNQTINPTVVNPVVNPKINSAVNSAVPTATQQPISMINPVINQPANQKKPRHWIKFVLIFLLIAILAGAGWFAYKYFFSSKINNQAEIQTTPDIGTLLAKIKNGEKPEPAEINLILQDVNVPLPSRFIVLELASQNYNSSRDTLEKVFQRSADDSVLQGKISLILAGHGENIGDLVVQRYPNVSPEAKFYYAQTIVVFGRKDAIPVLLPDAQQTQNNALRDTAIDSLIKLDPSSTQILNLAMSAIHSAKALPMGERGTTDDLNQETIAMHAVTALAEASGPQATDRMLTIARDESIAIDVRLTSLEALSTKISTMSPSEKKTLSGQLTTLGNQVNKSSQLSGTDKERMNGRITLLQGIITTGQ